MGTSARGPASAVVVESAGNPFTRTPRHRGQDQRRQHHGAHSVQAILHQGRHQGAITSLDMASEGPLADVPQSLAQLAASKFLDDKAKAVITSFLALDSHAESGAPEANAYEFQSG